ncbi:MAG: hypothetical protein ACLQHS_19230 [Candidatus Limnocylindrales bacterium]
MVSVSWVDSDQFDALMDAPEGGAEAVVGVLVLLSRLKVRDRDSAAHPGTFASERALRAALGESSRFTDLYRRVGVLDGLPTPLWRWQTNYDNDPKRRRVSREKKRGRDATSDATGDATNDVTDDGSGG